MSHQDETELRQLKDKELGDDTQEDSAEELEDEDLEKVSGGAYPTAVNSQITD
jgi:hypothetical protein